MKGFFKPKVLSPREVETLLRGEPDVKSKAELRLANEGLSEGALEARRYMERVEQLSKQNERTEHMTVSLYTSTASGKKEIVVQTNAQSLDLFIAGLADAVISALDRMDDDSRPELMASLLRNAFPVAFAIAGYKAEKVVESRMLICGTAAPEKSSLLAHSRS